MILPNTFFNFSSIVSTQTNKNNTADRIRSIICAKKLIRSLREERRGCHLSNRIRFETRTWRKVSVYRNRRVASRVQERPSAFSGEEVRCCMSTRIFGEEMQHHLAPCRSRRLGLCFSPPAPPPSMSFTASSLVTIALSRCQRHWARVWTPTAAFFRLIFEWSPRGQ